jgi:hypothetical protein
MEKVTIQYTIACCWKDHTYEYKVLWFKLQALLIKVMVSDSTAASCLKTRHLSCTLLIF